MKVREEIHPAWRARLAAAGVSSLATLLGEDPTHLPGQWTAFQKPGLRGRRRWRWQLPDGAPAVFVKLYQAPPLQAQTDRAVRQAARQSSAAWEYGRSLMLAGADVPAVAAVGFAEEMTGPLERRSVLLLEAAPGDGLDRAWSAAERAGAPITRGLARLDFARRLGRFIAAFHGTGLCHRDLYLCHVFVELDPLGHAAPRFRLIDLARVMRPRMRRMRWLLKDLSQLDASARQIGASRADRLRCLLAYLGLQRGAPRARWYARRIVRRSDRILARIARKARAS